MSIYDASNPLSEQFRREAVRNVAQNIASMRNQKELTRDAARTDDEPPADSVQLGVAAEPPPTTAGGEDLADISQGAQAPSTSAETAGSARATQGRPGEPRSEGGASSSRAPDDDALASGALLAAGASGLLEDKDPAVRRRKSEEARRLARDGVPVEILNASGEIVQGQIHPVQGPRPSLREMKAVPEAATHETAPADFAPEMDIAVTAAPLIDGSLDEDTLPG